MRAQRIEDRFYIRRLQSRFEVIQQRIINVIIRLEKCCVAAAQVNYFLEVGFEFCEIVFCPGFLPITVCYRCKLSKFAHHFRRDLGLLLVIAPGDFDQAGFFRIGVKLLNIRLKFIEQLSNAEIGEIMGRTEGAVKSLYHRTLIALRDDIQMQQMSRTTNGDDARARKQNEG